MTFPGILQNIYHFMVVLITMTTITMLGDKAIATLLRSSPTVITFMEQTRLLYSDFLWFYYLQFLVKVTLTQIVFQLCFLDFILLGLSVSKEASSEGNIQHYMFVWIWSWWTICSLVAFSSLTCSEHFGTCSQWNGDPNLDWTNTVS